MQIYSGNTDMDYQKLSVHNSFNSWEKSKLKTKQMNPLTLTKTIIQNYFFRKALTHKLGEPVHLTEGECQKVFDDLKADRMMAQKFV